MRIILANIDSGNHIRIDAAGNMITTIDSQAALAPLGAFTGEHRTVETSTDNQVIVFHGSLFFAAAYSIQG